MYFQKTNWLLLTLIGLVAIQSNVSYAVQPSFDSPATETRIANDSPSSVPVFKLVDPAQLLVQQRLLPLLHAAEVQQELKLDQAAVMQLEKLFEETDGDWWRARNLPLDQQRETVAKLESQLLTALPRFVSPDAMRRLQQLELRAQGTRMLLRPDVSEFLKLTEDQMKLLKERVNAVTIAANKVAELTQKREPAESAQQELAAAEKKEQKDLMASLSSSQVKKLTDMLGPDFDTVSLSRIYPMAPELIETDGWVGSSPGTLASLRGKVVLVHFYAFQCINCRRNLPRYNEWVDQFRDDDVVVIGIQTPETSAERDSQQIRAAAEKELIKYPVLLDLQSKNWSEWSNTMWPTVYVIDRKGYIRMWWQGELNWEGATQDKRIAEFVEQLLEE